MCCRYVIVDVYLSYFGCWFKLTMDVMFLCEGFRVLVVGIWWFKCMGCLYAYEGCSWKTEPCFSNVFHQLVVEPKQENIGQSDARLIGRLEERARQAMFRTFWQLLRDLLILFWFANTSCCCAFHIFGSLFRCRLVRRGWHFLFNDKMAAPIIKCNWKKLKDGCTKNMVFCYLRGVQGNKKPSCD